METTFQCARCGTGFPMGTDHTELVRRDFVDRPRPARVERLCTDCWATYVGDFLDEDFESTLDGYRE